MGLSSKLRKSLPSAKRNGNEYKLGQELLAYKTRRSIASIDEAHAACAKHPGADERYRWEWSYCDDVHCHCGQYYCYSGQDASEALPLVKLQQMLEDTDICRSPFAVL